MCSRKRHSDRHSFRARQSHPPHNHSNYRWSFCVVFSFWIPSRRTIGQLLDCTRRSPSAECLCESKDNKKNCESKTKSGETSRKRPPQKSPDDAILHGSWRTGRWFRLQHPVPRRLIYQLVFNLQLFDVEYLISEENDGHHNDRQHGHLQLLLVERFVIHVFSFDPCFFHSHWYCGSTFFRWWQIDELLSFNNGIFFLNFIDAQINKQHDWVNEWALSTTHFWLFSDDFYPLVWMLLCFHLFYVTYYL